MHDRAADRLDAEAAPDEPPVRLRLQGVGVRRAAVHRPVGPRLRQRRAHRRRRDHRQRPRRHQRSRSTPRSCTDWIAPPGRPLRRRARTAAWPSTTSTTSRCCGTTPTATCTRSRPATTRCATAPGPTPRRSRPPTRRRRTLGPGGVGLDRVLLVRARLGRRGRLVEQPARPPRPRRRAVRRVVPAADAGLRAAARQRILDYSRRALLPARRGARRPPATPPHRRCACARRGCCGTRPTPTRAGSPSPSTWSRACTTGSTPTTPAPALAITEYNWGALDHINGALAQADVLGIFGREGLDLATLWGPPAATIRARSPSACTATTTAPGTASARSACSATSADQGAAVGLRGAARVADGALTVMVVNKTAGALTSQVTIETFAAAPAAFVFRYGASSPAPWCGLPTSRWSATGSPRRFGLRP